MKNTSTYSALPAPAPPPYPRKYADTQATAILTRTAISGCPRTPLQSRAGAGLRSPDGPGLKQQPHWVLSGSVTGWYDELVSVFDLIVFVYVPTDIRMERLRRREAERYGDAILPGNSRHQASAEFIEWASAYDSGTRSGRSCRKTAY